MNITSFIFRTALAWYLISTCFEALFPGLVSNYISLDWFLWCVILLAVISFSIQRKKA